MSQTDSPDETRGEETNTAATFHLQCTDCSYERSIEVGSMDALEIADRHQEEFGDTSRDHLDHFVTITNDRRSAYIDE